MVVKEEKEVGQNEAGLYTYVHTCTDPHTQTPSDTDTKANTYIWIGVEDTADISEQRILRDHCSKDSQQTIRQN